MTSFKEHPVWLWAGVIITVFGVLGSVGGLYWYFNDERIRNIEWNEDDVRWNNRQREDHKILITRQQEIKKELATQSVKLDELHTLIRDHWKQREDRFEELETEHKAIISTISTANDDLNFRLGFHAGRKKGCKNE